MTRPSIFALALVAACSAACMTAADADAAPPPRARGGAPRATKRAEDAQQAQRWFVRGVAAARTGDLAGARRAFGLAYALVPSVDILWNLAASERLAGDAVAAVRHLRAYAASPDARVDRKKLADEELVPELEAITARLRVDEAEGAVVIVDGEEVPRSTTLDVSPGVHAVVVRRDGEERALATLAVAGATTTVSRDAPSDASSADAANARSAKPVIAPITPITSAAAPIAFDAVPIPLARAPSATTPEVVTRAPGRTTAVLALGGAAVAALATGVVFAVVARSDQAEADRLEVKMRDDDRTCRRAATLCADYDSATSAAQRSMLLSSSLLATGGVLGGAAVAAWVLWPTTTTRVIPTVSKDVAGIGVVGRF